MGETTQEEREEIEDRLIGYPGDSLVTENHDLRVDTVYRLLVHADRLAQIERQVRELAETYESMRFPYLHHADDCAKQLRALIDPPEDT